MKEYEKYLIETLRNNADHFMTTDYEWSNALVHLLLDSADAIEQKKECAEMIGLDSEICDLPYTLRSIVVSKPNMGSFSKETILKAADAIEELLAAVPHWISVEERLPEQGERVLVSNGGFICESYLSQSGKWQRGGVDMFFMTPTHWMPLLKPPKEVE